MLSLLFFGAIKHLSCHYYRTHSNRNRQTHFSYKIYIIFGFCAISSAFSHELSSLVVHEYHFETDCLWKAFVRFLFIGPFSCEWKVLQPTPDFNSPNYTTTSNWIAVSSGWFFFTLFFCTKCASFSNFFNDVWCVSLSLSLPVFLCAPSYLSLCWSANGHRSTKPAS